MSNYRTSISKRYTPSGNCSYRVHYSYISPVDGKRHRSAKGGFKYRREAIRWLQFEFPQFRRERENVITPILKGGAVL